VDRTRDPSFLTQSLRSWRQKGTVCRGTLGGVTIGRAVYEPWLKWSTHIGSKSGATLCRVEHVGLVVSGRATAGMEDGTVIEIRAGDLLYIPAGHDSWVVGDEEYISSISSALRNTRFDSIGRPKASSRRGVHRPLAGVRNLPGTK
jgi:hypothetical protein